LCCSEDEELCCSEDEELRALCCSEDEELCWSEDEELGSAQTSGTVIIKPEQSREKSSTVGTSSKNENSPEEPLE